MALNSMALTAGPGPRDIFLDDTGNFAFVSDDSYIAQSLYTRLNFFQGEWFLDTTLGIDYFGSIFVKPANILTAEALIKNTILETKGVTKLLSYSDNYVEATRVYSVNFSVLTIYSSQDAINFSNGIVLAGRKK